MFVRTYAGAVVGIDAVVTVEVNIAGGGLGMYLRGTADNAVKEMNSASGRRSRTRANGSRVRGRQPAPGGFAQGGFGLRPADRRGFRAMGCIDAEAVAEPDVRRRSRSTVQLETRAGA